MMMSGRTTDRVGGVIAALLVGMMVAGCNPKPAGSGDSAMSSKSKLLTSKGAPEKFVLEYRTAGGLPLGPDLRERQTFLRLDRNEGTAFWEVFRSPSDGPGEPIGAFRNSLADAKFQDVEQCVKAAKLEKLPPPTGGGLGDSLLTLQYEKGETFIDKSFPSSDVTALEQLEDLMFELDQITGSLAAHPVGAIRVSVEHAAGSSDGRFRLMITNIGVEPVTFTDPRTLGEGHDDRWCGVQIAEFPEERPGYTAPPLRWSRLHLALATEDLSAGPHIVLEPGKVFSAQTVEWAAPRSGVRYLVQGILINYAGPRERQGHYRIRGAVFSDPLEIVP